VKIVWYSEIKWSYLTTRKQHLLRNFPATDTILFFQPFSLVGTNNFLPRKEGNIIYLTLPVYRKSKWSVLNKLLNTTLIRTLLYAATNIWQRLLTRFILKQAPDLKIYSNLYFLPYWNKSDAAVWDYNDDPEQFGPQVPWAMTLLDSFLRSNSNMVMACSRFLQRKLETQYNRQVYHIPNGVDLTVFPQLRDKPLLTNRRMLGYVGVISSWFFDFDLVQKLSHAFPEYEIKLYGPVDRDAREDLETLLNNANVHYHAAVDHSEIPAILATFRLGLIPLKSIPQVWQAASAKYLQYLAAGIPVVATHMEQFEGFASQAYLCHTHEETISAIESALDLKSVGTIPSFVAYDWRMLGKEYHSRITQHIEKVKGLHI